jgi:hypothetical protein
MNIERVKQFIKEVRWGFLATTDGRKVGVPGYGGLRPDERPMTNSPAHLFTCSFLPRLAGLCGHKNDAQQRSCNGKYRLKV